ncbi:MAG: glycerol-3-phosphate 1-O-acyltransferase PlsY [Syntrophomonadaceae bacterium]|nr:glycerol-3-phosphate 1-O-acyltransferase PlsY [Syntrophomonadaceae bacterium]
MLGIGVVIASYMIGSIPFSFLVSAWFAKRDIRKHGSGNVGSTNVLRTMGTKYAALAMLGDVLKGVAAAWLGMYIGGGIWILLCSAAAVIGHCFPLFLKMKGGKGVATSAGVLIYLVPSVLGTLVVIFVGTVLIWRRVSLGSIMAALFAPFVTILMYPDNSYLIGVAFVLPLIVIIRHKDNIKRLINGTEPKIGE